MSKVAIQGNASGTGTFTIASPNSNTDRTLTLPDEAGTVLTSASSITQNSGPAFRAYVTGTPSIAHNTNVKLTFDVKTFDTDSKYDNATNYRFTPTVAGYYQVNMACRVGTAGGNDVFLRLMIYKNGEVYSSDPGGATETAAGSDSSTTVSDIVYLDSDDYIEGYIYYYNYTTLGSGTLYGDTSSQTFMSACYIRS